MDLYDISKEILTEMLKGIDEGIHVIDTDGITIYYNQVAAKHDGMRVEEVLGKPLLSAFPSLTVESSTLLKVLQTKQNVPQHTQSYTNLHGTKIETINTTTPIWVEGKLVGAMEIAKDYSSLKNLSEKMLDLQQEKSHISSRKKKQNSVTYSLADLKTLHVPFQQMKKQALQLARSQSSILVFGESGTGKELFVQGLHEASTRRDKPFIAQNCAAIPETLLESILFGTAKGSYTGAVDRPGLFELADGGTLFLDELHTMPITLQTKFLRVLEDGMVRRVGSQKNTEVDVRIIAAMNIHPKKALETEKLRVDLFYRLNVLTFELPALRERREDIPYLAKHFVQLYSERLNKQIMMIADQVMQVFTNHSWPGNVRELKHTIEYMVNVCGESQMLTLDHLPLMLKDVVKSNLAQEMTFKSRMEQFELRLLQEALANTHGNIKKAATLLQIPRQTLQYKLQKYSDHFS